MLWITKYKHNKIVAQYEKVIGDTREALNRKDAMVEITRRLTTLAEKLNPIAFDGFGGTGATTISERDIMECLDDTVPRYIDDYFGGKVIKQESTPVTILDENGKATYSQTAQKPDKGKTYKLVIK